MFVCAGPDETGRRAVRGSASPHEARNLHLRQCRGHAGEILDVADPVPVQAHELERAQLDQRADVAGEALHGAAHCGGGEPAPKASKGKGGGAGGGKSVQSAIAKLKKMRN